MRVSWKWLNEMTPLTLEPTELAHTLLEHAQEVASVEPLCSAQGLIIGHVLTCEPHPQADKLSVTSVDVGLSSPLSIVCGAPNVARGQKVIVAPIGVTLPGGMTMEKVVLRGVPSEGMICSLEELGLEKKYHGEEGIHVLPDDAPIGGDAIAIMHLDDTVIDVELTPNRADLMSMMGMAYESAACCETPLTTPTHDVQESEPSNPFQITCDTPLCEAYYGRMMHGVVIQESPWWLKSRLIAAGIRPINNVVDITNYVMLETGQPLHAFDADRFGSQHVHVRQAQEKETFVTLDGHKRVLSARDIVITNGTHPVALGGVMGGLDSEVTAQTTALFLESARFDPVTIRKTARRLDLRSESSNRFERGVDPNRTLYALERATTLLQHYASAQVMHGVVGMDTFAAEEHRLTLRLDRLNRVLGTTLSSQTVRDLLDRLRLSSTGDTELEVIIPSRRLDLTTEQDLIEEVGRLYGYNRLPATLPAFSGQGGLTEKQRLYRRLKTRLTQCGFDETIHYALVSEAQSQRFDVLKDKSLIRLAHPLSSEHEVLTLSLLGPLCETLAYHTHRQMPHAAFFELGKRYGQEGEEDVLAFVAMGQREQHFNHKEAFDFYFMKGVFEDLLSFYHLKADAEPLAHESFHPHQAAQMKIGDQIVGVVGVLHPRLARAYDGDVMMVAELYLGRLNALKEPSAPYKVLTKTPTVTRDVAVIIDRNTLAQAVVDETIALALPALISADIIDVYEGKPLQEGERSLTLRVRFNDPAKTLETQTVDTHMEALQAHLKATFKARIRD